MTRDGSNLGISHGFLSENNSVGFTTYICLFPQLQQANKSRTHQLSSHLAHFTETVLTKNNPDPLSYTRHAGPFAFEADVAFIDGFTNYRVNKGYMSASYEHVHLHACEEALVTSNNTMRLQRVPDPIHMYAYLRRGNILAPGC